MEKGEESLDPNHCREIFGLHSPLCRSQNFPFHFHIHPHPQELLRVSGLQLKGPLVSGGGGVGMGVRLGGSELPRGKQANVLFRMQGTVFAQPADSQPCPPAGRDSSCSQVRGCSRLVHVSVFMDVWMQSSLLGLNGS